MKQTKRRLRSAARERRWRLAELGCAAALVVFVVLIAIKLLGGARIAREETRAAQTLSELAEDAATAAPAAAEATAPDPLPYFDKLLAENPDTVGLIGIEDQALYVCRANDNQYYMNHRFDGSESAAGAIFMDFRCELWPTSMNLILYGHNMKDGARFGKLKRYQRAEYLAEHPAIRFATLYEAYTYLPFAVVLVSTQESGPDAWNYAVPDFPDAERFNAFVRAAKARSLLDIPTEPVYGDHLLTLVTCSNELEDGRLVLLCRRDAAF